MKIKDLFKVLVSNTIVVIQNENDEVLDEYEGCNDVPEVFYEEDVLGIEPYDYRVVVTIPADPRHKPTYSVQEAKRLLKYIQDAEDGHIQSWETLEDDSKFWEALGKAARLAERLVRRAEKEEAK